MPKLLTLCPMATWTVRKSNPVNTANINQMPPLFWQGRHFIFGASPHNSRLTAQAPLRRLRHGICVAKMLDNVGLRYPHRASGAKAPRTLRPLPLLRFAVSATGGAHLCSIQYYLRFWLSICRTSLAVSALRIMRYCLGFSVVGQPAFSPLAESGSLWDSSALSAAGSVFPSGSSAGCKAASSAAAAS